jgi:PPIC-type PPIASE domain
MANVVVVMRDASFFSFVDRKNGNGLMSDGARGRPDLSEKIRSLFVIRIRTHSGTLLATAFEKESERGPRTHTSRAPNPAFGCHIKSEKNKKITMAKILPAKWWRGWALRLVAPVALASLRCDYIYASAFCAAPAPAGAPPTRRLLPVSFESGYCASCQPGRAGGVRAGPLSSLHVISHNQKKKQHWLVDAVEQAFSNEHFTTPPEGIRATARHILLNSAEECRDAVHQIETGLLSFEEAATLYSICPSKFDGGSLGCFHRGTMVPEFDSLVFDPSTPLQKVVGPVHTPFGYHIVVVDKRTGV